MKVFKTMLMGAVLASGSFAAADELNADAPEIERDGAELVKELDVRPDDRDFTNTAIVASNRAAGPALVVCTALNANGRPLGRAAMRVPGNGLRYLRASDVSNGVDYIGQVRCLSRNESVAGSAFLVGPGGVTALPVQEQIVNGVVHIQADVTASF